MSPPPGLPTLRGDTTAEAVVVGLGGSGLTAVNALLQRGVRTVGIDAGGIASGAAGRNGGFLLAGLAEFHHVAVERLGRERAARCYRVTLAELDRIFADCPSSTRRTGSLRIAADENEADDCHDQLVAMRADSLPVEPYDGPFGRGLRFPEDGAMQPLARCRSLAGRAFEMGARLFVDSPVTSIEPGRVVTASGAVACDHVLVCVDGALEVLVPRLAAEVRSVRLQMLATAPIPGEVVPCPIYRRYGLDYFQQLVTGEVALGGARDAGGDKEWTRSLEPSAAVQGVLDARLAEVVPVATTVTHRWAGTVGYTEDRLPIVRAVDEGVYVAGGYSGTGNVVGAVAARALVELALDGDDALASLFDGGGPTPAGRSPAG